MSEKRQREDSSSSTSKSEAVYLLRVTNWSRVIVSARVFFFVADKKKSTGSLLLQWMQSRCSWSVTSPWEGFLGYPPVCKMIWIVKPVFWCPGGWHRSLSWNSLLDRFSSFHEGHRKSQQVKTPQDEQKWCLQHEGNSTYTSSWFMTWWTLNPGGRSHVHMTSRYFTQNP